MRNFRADIAVFFDPKDTRSRVLYNVPLETKRVFKLSVKARVGRNFSVEIRQTQSGWIQLSKHVETTPFVTTVQIDTTGLEAVTRYQEDLIFTVNGVEVHREPIYLTTQLYDPQVSQENTVLIPLNIGKKRKNPLISILSGLEVLRNFAVVFIFLWLLLLGLSVAILVTSLFGSG